MPETSHQETLKAESCCVIPWSVLFSVDSICSSRGVGYYSLQCLSLFLEAVVLYDRVVAYNNRPRWLDPPEGETVELMVSKAGVTVTDPFQELPREEYWALTSDIHTAYFNAAGHSASSTLIECPDAFLKANRHFLDKCAETDIRASLKALGAEDEPETIADAERGTYLRRCAGRVIWQMENARQVAEAHGASGMMVLPEWYPLWGAERSTLTSEVGNKFKLLQEAIALQHCGDDIHLDLSALTIIALDTAIDRESIAENIVMLRRDYKELREIGHRYRLALEQAQNYKSISEVVREWRDAWDLVLKNARSGKVSLRRKLFSWDVLKKGSWSGMLFEAASITGKELSDIVVKKGLTIAETFEQEFLMSAPIEKNLRRLFNKP
jgi:hypothetical protein